MAFITATDTRTETGLVGRAQAAFADMGERFAKRRQFNRTISELSELSGAELADLGITRGSIRAVAHEAVYGK